MTVVITLSSSVSGFFAERGGGGNAFCGGDGNVVVFFGDVFAGVGVDELPNHPEKYPFFPSIFVLSDSNSRETLLHFFKLKSYSSKYSCFRIFECCGKRSVIRLHSQQIVNNLH